MQSHLAEKQQHRLAATYGLSRILQHGHTLDQLQAESQLAPFTREMLFGVCRHYFSLRTLLDAQLKKPLRQKDTDIVAAMLVGAYQLFHSRQPHHAVVSATVDLLKPLKKPWAKGLVNANLRSMIRTAEKAEEEVTAHHDHPEWLAECLSQQYAASDALLEANNTRAPMSLRANLTKLDRVQAESQLNDAGITFHPGHLAETMVLDAPIPVRGLQAYAAGMFAVQDGGAQLAVSCWNEAMSKPGGRVLDACAAPGGKLHHALERFADLEFVALELSPTRLETLRQECARLGHDPAVCQLADASSLDWWDGVAFQTVLIDAPCSGTGTLRRNPDIKILSTPDRVIEHQQIQRALLNNLWATLSPGGTMLYSTCSLLAAENDTMVKEFLATHSDASAEPLQLATGEATEHGWQLTPLDPATDGFYYSRLVSLRYENTHFRRGTSRRHLGRKPRQRSIRHYFG